MPELYEHINTSIIKFGDDGKEYHVWIDQYKVEGYRHRQVFHHKEGIEVGVLLFGEKARKHLEQHIRDDYKTEDIPTIRQLRLKNRVTDGLKKKHMEVDQNDNKSMQD